MSRRQVKPKADEMEMRLLTNKCTDLNTTEHLNAFDMNSSSNNVNFCNEDSCNVSHTHNLVSTNSFELNTATSLSDDSGVPLTNSSISSGDSYRIGLCKFELELVESDGEVSQFDSLDNSSDGGMSAENFNTLKKGPLAPIDPPPEFQDSPNATLIRQQVLPDYDLNAAENVVPSGITHWFSQNSVVKKERNFDFLSSTVTEEKILNKKNYSMEDIYGKRIYSSDSSFSINMYKEPNKCILDHKEYILESNTTTHNEIHCKHFKAGKRGLASPKELHLDKLSEIHDYDQYYELKNNYPTDIHQKGKSSYIFSPLHHNNVANRPNSRNSLNSRLSSSHNSLSLPNANKADDSIFITQAMSHDTLLSREISDFYNVPIDSDIYAFPVDMIKADLNIYHGNNEKVRSRLKHSRNIKKRRRVDTTEATGIEKYGSKLKMSNNQRHSALENTIEPLHMTLVEVKRFYHNLYSGSNNSSTFNRSNFSIKIHVNNSSNERNVDVIEKSTTANHKIFSTGKSNTHDSTTPINKKISEKNYIQNTSNSSKFINQNEKKPPFSMNLNLKQKFCRIFRFRKNHDNSRSSIEDCTDYISSRTSNVNEPGEKIDKKQKFSTRALPPLPNKSQKIHNVTVTPPKEPEFNSVHLASSIEKVKECGWYWGPISSEAAEKVLSNEPDGSFIVRDSSDDHYIFSLSFKLNFCVRHVRIEQDQGTFSFGPYAKFKSRTITEFIEKAVEHSRSGRYLFFLHRRPEHGPMRVQLTNPVSRFKHIQSLQHMCRFVILKAVIRKDLIRSLPLPRRLLDYLSYKHCYSEQVESDSSQSQVSEDRA